MGGGSGAEVELRSPAAYPNATKVQTVYSRVVPEVDFSLFREAVQSARNKAQEAANAQERVLLRVSRYAFNGWVGSK